jgi:hypothetical protein
VSCWLIVVGWHHDRLFWLVEKCTLKTENRGLKNRSLALIASPVRFARVQRHPFYAELVSVSVRLERKYFKDAETISA